jgi:hypothetical protein
MLQLLAAQVAAPVCIAWYYQQNSARLEWALENGISIDQIRVSPATGLIEFPLMTDADFLYLGGGGQLGPRSVVGGLWAEFMDGIDSRIAKEYF